MNGALRRWGPWILLVLVLGVGLAVGADRHGGHQTVQQRTLSIAEQVRCPVCEGESAAQSNTAAAELIRRVIHDDLTRGQSSSQILRQLEADYGATILESPPTSGISLWVWILPPVIVAAAVAGLVLGFRHWRRQPPAPGAPGLAQADQELVHRALVQHRAQQTRTGTAATGGEVKP